MSRIGRKPITVPAGVEISISGSAVTVKGKNGSLSQNIAAPITVKQDGTTILVERPNDERLTRSLHGLSRTLINNMIEGVREEPAKKVITYDSEKNEYIFNIVITIFIGIMIVIIVLIF